MVKDTDEISQDKSYVTDQDPESLRVALRRVRTYMDAIIDAKNRVFTPMISRRVVSVEIKISKILRHMQSTGKASLAELLEYEESLADAIASFIGVLELIRVHRLIINTDGDDCMSDAVHGIETQLILNTDESTILHEEHTDIGSAKKVPS